MTIIAATPTSSPITASPQPVAVKLPRYISAPLSGASNATYQIIADAVIEERHSDNVESTDQPVEQGSVISDHAYRRPSRLNLTYMWQMASATNSGSSQSFLQTLYSAVLNVQNSFSLLTIATGKRLYKNMLIESLDVTTDKTSENILELKIGLKEIIIATTTVVSLQSASNQSNPQQTAPVLNVGGVNLSPASNFNPNGAPALNGGS